MSYTRRTTNARRSTYLRLSSQVEGQLREAYDRRYLAGQATQTGLATKLGVNKSAIHRRLTGRCNMTVETIADMVWALDLAIKVEIYDPTIDHTSNSEIFAKQEEQKPNLPTSKTPSSSGLPLELMSILSGNSTTPAMVVAS